MENLNFCHLNLCFNSCSIDPLLTMSFHWIADAFSEKFRKSLGMCVLTSTFGKQLYSFMLF